jgi:uncharacterized membrane protein
VTLKVFEVISIVLAALVAGVFWGPWVALSRSMRTFAPELLLPIVHRMNRNLEPVMTVLMPVALLSIVPVLFLSYGTRRETFILNLTGLALFLVALLVTVLVEVPIVKEISTWTVTTLPDQWEERRDRWVSFHAVRILAGVAGLSVLVVGAIF